jgi:DNA-binding transcriptional LysR family regulator
VVGRLFARHDKSDLRYEALVEEPVAAVVRTGHPLTERPSLKMKDLSGHGWIVPPTGSVLRHRFELMFQEEGLEAPTDLIETTALLFMTKMLEQSDLIGVVASDVALYYQEHGLVAILPVELPCKMDAFGLITRTDRLLAPAAKVMLRALKEAARNVYGSTLDMSNVEI